MSRQTIAMTDDLHAYLLSATLDEPEPLKRLRDETAARPNANMQISPEQGQFMRLLAEVAGVRRAIEIGTFTGYSAACMALALPADGRLIACDVNEENTAIAQRYWAELGLAEKIDLRLAPALETLSGLLAEGAAGTFDFAFIDADKENTPEYFEQCLKLLRPGGVIAIDNALSGGRVLDPEQHPNGRIMDEVNRAATRDERVTSSLVPIGDGLLLARKR